MHLTRSLQSALRASTATACVPSWLRIIVQSKRWHCTCRPFQARTMYIIASQGRTVNWTLSFSFLPAKTAVANFSILFQLEQAQSGAPANWHFHLACKMWEMPCEMLVIPSERFSSDLATLKNNMTDKDMRPKRIAAHQPVLPRQSRVTRCE